MELKSAPATAQELDFTKRPVSEEGRMPALSLTMAWWAVCSAMFWIVVAATLASIYGTKHTLIGVGLTVITYAIVNATITKYALRSGLSVSLFSRLLFGRSGSALATFLFAITAIYYTVFEGSVIAVAATFVWPSIDYKVAALLVVLYSVPLVFGSVQHWLDKINGILLPIYVVGLIAAIVMAVSEYGYSSAWLTNAGSAPSDAGWWHVYVAYMGVWVMMMYTFDFARFGKKKDEKYHAYFTFGAPFFVVQMLVSALAGIFLVNTIPVDGALNEVSAVKSIIVLMGLFGFIFVLVTQTRINTANLYLSTVNFEAFARLTLGLNLSKVVSAIVVGAITYVLMLADVFHYLLAALAYQGIFVVAWVGVALAYIWGPGRTAPLDAGAQPDEAYPAYNAAGLVAWFGSVAIGVILMQIPSLASFSAPATVAASFLMFSMARGRAAPAAA